MGQTNVDSMLSKMTSSQFDEWLAYDQIEPIGSYNIYLASAMTTAAVLNVNRRKGARPIKPSEIVPNFLESARRMLRRFGMGKRQTTQEQIAIAERLNIAFGGKDLRDKKNG